jgi:hypothetical protein
MPTPPAEIIQLVSVFAVAFTAPTYAKALVLLYGAILAPGRRTVTAALRAMGLGDEKHFTNYHRVLNRDHWSPWVLSRLLLSLIIALCLPADAPLRLVIDETLERRRGRQIKYKGWFYDAVRSTAVKVSTCLGIRWMCLAILVPVPWSARLWALPFMVVPALSTQTSLRLKKRPRKLVGWAGLMIERVRRWHPEREIQVVGDGSYAALELVRQCQGLPRPVRFISRLRLDAQLYAPPAPQPKSKRGPKPKKGGKLPTLAERLSEAATPWQRLTVSWYGGNPRTVEFITGTALWYHPGSPPLSLRWVLVRCPPNTPKKERFPPTGLFCSEPTVTAPHILAAFLQRWNLEVTFEELRAFLGLETQRQWSDRAIERTTPCLFGLFSLVVLMAKVGYPDRLPIRQTAWYAKEEATFSDVLASVRQALWSGGNYTISPDHPDLLLLPKPLAFSLFEMVCYTNCLIKGHE